MESEEREDREDERDRERRSWKGGGWMSCKLIPLAATKEELEGARAVGSTTIGLGAILGVGGICWGWVRVVAGVGVGRGVLATLVLDSEADEILSPRKLSSVWKEYIPSISDRPSIISIMSSCISCVSCIVEGSRDWTFCAWVCEMGLG